MSDTSINGAGSNPYLYNEQKSTRKTDGNGEIIDAVYDNGDKSVSVDDFLQLMVAQLQNQDFMNPVDDTQYLTQLAQFASMQQMQEMAYYSQTNFMMGLVGKDVTVAKLSYGGDLQKVTGTVEKVSYVNKEFLFYIGGNPYTMDQLMEVNTPKPTDPPKPDPDPDVKPDPDPDVKPDPDPEVKPDPDPEVKPDPDPAPETKPDPEPPIT